MSEKSVINHEVRIPGLITLLMAGLWAAYLAPALHPIGSHAAQHSRIIVALVILVIALLAAGYSLLLTVQYDNPDMAEFYRKYYAVPDRSYPAYFASAIRVIRLNNAVVKRKSRFLLVSTLPLFLSVLVIIM